MTGRLPARALCALVSAAALVALPALPALPVAQAPGTPSAVAEPTAAAEPSPTQEPSPEPATTPTPKATPKPTPKATPKPTSKPTTKATPKATPKPTTKREPTRPTTTPEPPGGSASSVPPPNLASDLLAEAAAEVGVAQAALLEAQARLSASQVALAAARAALEQAKAEDEAAREALAGAVLSERKAEQAVRAVQTRIGDTRQTLGAVAREAYQGGNLSTLSVVLEAETPSEFADRLTSMRAVLEAGDSALATLASDQAELAANEDRLSAVRALREKLATEASQRLTASREAEQEAAKAEQARRSLVEEKAAALTAAEDARAADLARYQTFLGTSTRLGATVVGFSAQLRTSRSAITGTGVFVRPGTGQVTSPFGQRFHPILGYWKLHTGTDLGYGDGTVYAADQGTVVIAGHDRAYGNMLVVDHGIVNGKPLATLYAHQSGFLVGVGDKVRKGQPIGRVGSTGFSTGPHLHFEVRIAGEVTDPWPWIVAAPRP